MHNEISRYLGQFIDDLALARRVSIGAASLLSTLPLDGTPIDLPADFTAEVATAALPFASYDPVEVSEVVHNAFLIAAELGSRRARAAATDPGLFLSFMRVVRMFERLVQEHVARVNDEARAAIGRTVRPLDTAPDPSSSREIAPAGGSGTSELSADGLPIRPGWMDDAVAVTPIVLRRNTDIPMPAMSALPQPSAAALSHNEAVIAVPSSNVEDALPDLLRLFPFSAAAVGLSVLPEQLLHSVGWCRRALTMRDAGALTDAGDVIRCAEVADVLIAGADQLLVRTIATQILAPIHEMGGYRRQILLETLGAWVRNPDAGVPVIATTLQKHPQTVRYRLRQLRAVMDDVMNDEHKVFCLRNAFLLDLV